MLVGNHTLMGLYDTPVLVGEIYRRRSVVIRAMGDHVHSFVACVVPSAARNRPTPSELGKAFAESI